MEKGLMEKDKKLIEMFEDFCKKNDKEIKNKENFMPMCITINKDYSIGIIAFSFSNQDEKIKMRNMLKKLIVVQNIKGYILIQDAKVTKLNQETGERHVSDVAMRNLFTPKFAISRMQEYCNGVLGEVIEITDRKEMSNTWDLWNSRELDEKSDKFNEEYSKYKAEHPELYKGVYELDDYNKVQSKGKLIYAYKIINIDKEFRYYQADDLEQEDKDKLEEIMNTIKLMNGVFKYKFVQVDKDGIEIK